VIEAACGIFIVATVLVADAVFVPGAFASIWVFPQTVDGKFNWRHFAHYRSFGLIVLPQWRHSTEPDLFSIEISLRPPFRLRADFFKSHYLEAPDD
jgi:hypothetical protein